MRALSLAVVCLLVVCHSTRAQQAPLQTSDRKLYKVSMTTAVTIPRASRIQALRVWHAVPPKRPWMQGKGDVGATQIRALPSSGVLRYDRNKASHHNYWQVSRGLRPARTLRFTTTFDVISVQRVFRPDRTRTAWTALSARRKGNSRLFKVAIEARRKMAPAKAVLQYCIWLKKNITYDASVSHKVGDVDATVKLRKGHCGHFYEALAQMCGAVGIKIRRVVGLNLYSRDGRRGGLSHIRADFTNIHTWAEVYFGKVGWVEVELSFGSKAYTIPARFVQNNKWFQNYAVWYREKGRWSVPTWSFDGRRWTSRFALSHTISYSEQRLPSSSPR